MKISAWFGMLLIALSLGAHFGWFGDLPTSVKSTNSTDNTVTPVPANMTIPDSITTLFTNASLGAFIALLGSEPIWMINVFLGFMMIILAVNNPFHSNYDSSYPSYPSYRSIMTDESNDEDPDGSVEARSMRNESTEILMCPMCGAPLKFGSAAYSTCGYCGNEVRRIREVG